MPISTPADRLAAIAEQYGYRTANRVVEIATDAVIFGPPTAENDHHYPAHARTARRLAAELVAEFPEAETFPDTPPPAPRSGGSTLATGTGFGERGVTE